METVSQSILGFTSASQSSDAIIASFQVQKTSCGQNNNLMLSLFKLSARLEENFPLFALRENFIRLDRPCMANDLSAEEFSNHFFSQFRILRAS